MKTEVPARPRHGRSELSRVTVGPDWIGRIGRPRHNCRSARRASMKVCAHAITPGGGVQVARSARRSVLGRSLALVDGTAVDAPVAAHGLQLTPDGGTGASSGRPGPSSAGTMREKPSLGIDGQATSAKPNRRVRGRIVNGSRPAATTASTSARVEVRARESDPPARPLLPRMLHGDRGR
jgi:hypothetical protein